MSLSKNGKSIIGIMGMGVVGDAVSEYFERRGYALRGYDPYRNIGSEQSINESDVVFICVPTPYRPSMGFDAGALEDAVSRLDGSKVVVIKSTVLPGTTEAFQHRYSQHCFLFNPEFLREASAREDFVNADRQLVGYTAQSRHLAESLLSILPPAPYQRVMVAREAEMTKYMTNCFLAMKVSFANEIFDLATALDVDYNVVADAVAADPRIGASHLDVFDGGYRGYGGKCLPKDTKALIDLGDRLGVPLRMLRTTDRVNASLVPPSDQPAAELPFPISLNGDHEGAELDERAA
jgi:UDPglucose 6-dehydrogenase